MGAVNGGATGLVYGVSLEGGALVPNSRGPLLDRGIGWVMPEVPWQLDVCLRAVRL